MSLAACMRTAERDRPVYRAGNSAMHGGTPTIRRPFVPRLDDPSTTNDESNDQPRGYFGTTSVVVTSEESGNTYTLDADVDGTTLSRIYFPRGGWVDFPDCEIEPGVSGDCEDEEGRTWTFDGSSTQGTSDLDDEDGDNHDGDAEE